MKDYRLTCEDCGHEWIGQPYNEEYPEKCPECSSEEVWIGKEYSPLRIQSFWLILLIPNFLIFWS